MGLPRSMAADLSLVPSLVQMSHGDTASTHYSHVFPRLPSPTAHPIKVASHSSQGMSWCHRLSREGSLRAESPLQTDTCTVQAQDKEERRRGHRPTKLGAAHLGETVRLTPCAESPAQSWGSSPSSLSQMLWGPFETFWVPMVRLLSSAQESFLPICLRAACLGHSHCAMTKEHIA